MGVSDSCVVGPYTHLGGVRSEHKVHGLAAQQRVNVLRPHLHRSSAHRAEVCMAATQQRMRTAPLPAAFSQLRCTPLHPPAEPPPLLGLPKARPQHSSGARMHSADYTHTLALRFSRTCSLLTRRCRDLLVERVAASTSPRRAACTQQQGGSKCHHVDASAACDRLPQFRHKHSN